MELILHKKKKKSRYQLVWPSFFTTPFCSDFAANLVIFSFSLHSFRAKRGASEK